MLSFDTESTGLDVFHSARPFFVTTCTEDGDVTFWEAEVDPLTRMPRWDRDAIEGIEAVLADHDEWVAHNLKFDWLMLRSIGVRFPDGFWDNAHDTTYSGHVLWSNGPLNLTDQVFHHLNEDIRPLEKALEKAVKECRQEIRSAKLAAGKGGDFPIADWAIAEVGLPGFPSIRGSKSRKDGNDSVWSNDYWLPAAKARYQGMSRRHSYWTVLRDYSNADSTWTLPLCLRHRKLMRDRGLGEIYLAKLGMLRHVCEMEARGMTLSETRLDAIAEHHRAISAEDAETCVRIASERGHDLTLPRGSGNNNSLLAFCFAENREDGAGGLDFPVLERTGGGAASLNASVLEQLEHSLDSGDALDFVKALRDKRKRDKSVEFLVAYRKYWLPLEVKDVLEIPEDGPRPQVQAEVAGKSGGGSWRVEVRDRGVRGSGRAGVRSHGDDRTPGQVQGVKGAVSGRPPQPRQLQAALQEASPRARRDAALRDRFRVLHPSMNVTATDTLRGSMSNPNAQQVSKRDGFNNREAFGPAEGREWWTLDFENVERRIPAFESGEKVLIDLFERPDEAPFFGSEHLLVASIIYPDLFWTDEKFCPGCLGRGCEGECKKPVRLCDIPMGFKDLHKATWYQWVKNFNFAKAYGCGKRTGDRTAHREGAYDLVRDRLKEHTRLDRKWVAFANAKGYVETLPDRDVGAVRGYPLWCSKENGSISPTIPLCYHVSGTAMWCTIKAMVRVGEQLAAWREDGFDGWMICQVHDELIFDFPLGGVDNLPRVRKIRQLMERSGEDVGIPLKVSVGWHPVSWAREEEPREVLVT